MVIDWTNWRCRSALICLILMIWLHIESRKALVSSKLVVTATFFSMVVNNFLTSTLLEAARDSSAIFGCQTCANSSTPTQIDWTFPSPFNKRCVFTNKSLKLSGYFQKQKITIITITITITSIIINVIPMYQCFCNSATMKLYAVVYIAHPPTAIVLGAPLVSP